VHDTGGRVATLTSGGARRDVSVASRHVSLVRPGATEAHSDDTYEVDDCFGSELAGARQGSGVRGLRSQVWRVRE